MRKFSVILAVTMMILSGFAGITVSEEKSSKTGSVMLVMKNPLLTVAINRDRGGILYSFIPANTTREEVYISSDNKGGMCEHLLAGSSQNREISFSPHRMEFLEKTPEKVVVSFAYRMTSGELKDVEFQKIYTMTGDSAALGVEWKIINHTDRRLGLSPWIRNIVTAYDQLRVTSGQAPLDSDSSVMLQCGAFRKVASAADGFFEPARNWFSRVPKVPEEGKNIVNFIFDYNEVFQFYTVHFKHMHTMELLFRFIDLAPQSSWSGKFVITSGGSLPDVRFASKDVAADLIRSNGKLQLSLTSPRNIDMAEIRLLDSSGKVIGTGKTAIPALKVTRMEFPESAGDIFELQVIHQGKDLMIDRTYCSKNAKMDSSLTSFHAPRRPENFGKTVLTPWKKDIPPFEAPAPVKREVKLVKSDLGSLQVWAENSLERVMESDFPATDTAVSDYAYELAGARAERESFQIILRNTGDEPLKDISIELSGATLPGLKMKWNVLEYITTDRPSLGMNVIGRWPEVLAPERLFSIAPGQTRCVWVEFRIPRSAVSGNYTALAEVKQQGRVVAKMPVKIKVFDFELPQVPNLRSDVGRFYGNYLKMAQRYGFKGTQKELLEMLNLSILDHRMSPRGLVAPRNDLKAYEADLIRHIKLGANVFAFPTEQNCDLKTRKALEAIHARHNVVHLSYTYAFDEIHSEQIPTVNKWCKNWKKEHKIPILVVYYGGPVEPLYGSIDIWCRAHLKEDVQLLADRKGTDEIWHTNTRLYAMETPWVMERADIWKAFSVGMTGRLLWSVASWTNSPYIQTFRSGCNLHGVLYYPAPEGLREGVRLKVVADAVDDFDYLCILREEVAKAVKAGRSPELTAEAEALLQDQFFLDPALTGNFFRQKRNRVGELIEKIRNGSER